MTRWFYRFRGYLVIPPLIFTFFCFSFETETDYLIWPIGISLVFAGMILRIWAQQHLHYRLKIHKRLTLTGPYSFVRNPMYMGNIMICLGAAITSELLWFIPVTFLYYTGLYSVVVHYEERHLLDKYGESYRRYMSEVPRWFPKAGRFKNIGLNDKYFRQSVLVEIKCLAILLPYILKEVSIGVV